MGVADAYDRERLAELRLSAAVTDQHLSLKENTDYYNELTLRGAIVPTPAEGDRPAGFKMDLSVLNPNEVVEFFQRTTTIPEYRKYDSGGEFTGFETLNLEELVGKEGPDGNMQYLLAGSDPDGNKVYVDKTRTKGATKAGEDGEYVNGITLDILAQAGLAKLMSRTQDADNLVEGVVLSRYDPTLSLSGQRHQQQVSILADRKYRIKKAKEAAEEHKDDKEEFIKTIQEIMDDPALRGTGSPFELIKEAEPFWIALGGERQNIIPSNQVVTEPIDTGETSAYGRTKWKDPTSGMVYSEKGKTFQRHNDGKWVNIPSVDADGRIIPDSELEDYINSEESVFDLRDPITGDPLPVFDSKSDAVAASIAKSQSISAFVEAGDAEQLQRYFSDANIEDIDEMMSLAQEQIDNEKELYQMMRLVASQTTDPTTAMQEMERRVISPFGFTTSPSELGISGQVDQPAPTEDALEMFTDLESSYITIDQEEDSPTKGQFVFQSGLTGDKNNIDDAKAFYRGQIADLRRNDPNGTNPKYRGMRARTLEGIADAEVGFMIANAADPAGRSSVLGIGGNEAIFGSDSWHDRKLVAWWNGRPNPPGNTYNPQRDNIRVVVGEESVLSFGFGAGEQFPRLYVEVGGKESKASQSLYQFLFRGFSGEPQAGFDTLQRMVSPEDFKKLREWMNTEQYQEYVDTLRVRRPPMSNEAVAASVAKSPVL